MCECVQWIAKTKVDALATYVRAIGALPATFGAGRARKKRARAHKAMHIIRAGVINVVVASSRGEAIRASLFALKALLTSYPSWAAHMSGVSPSPLSWTSGSAPFFRSSSTVSFGAQKEPTPPANACKSKPGSSFSGQAIAGVVACAVLRNTPV